MRLVLLGVRGSTPAPGAAFVRYGGHTSCVAVIADGAARPALVLDAGTGIRDLPALLAGAAFAGSVVLTHLHWDHVQGLPFCQSIDNPDADVRLFVPTCPSGASAGDVLAGVMRPPYFPIGPDGLLGSWDFVTASPGPLRVAGAAVCVAEIPHKGGAALGIRAELDGASLAYLPDHALTDESGAGGEAALTLASGVSVLLHGGQFTRAEIATARSYGHATIDAAMALADRCDAGRLVLTHHSPARTDDQLDALARSHTRTPGGRPVSFARQGDVIDV